MDRTNGLYGESAPHPASPRWKMGKEQTSLEGTTFYLCVAIRVEALSTHDDRRLSGPRQL